MKGVFLLAWRHLSYHRGRSALLTLCILLSALLPVAVQMLVDTYGRALVARAQSTPLVVGAPGSRYDLVLNALYFRGRPPRTTSMAEVEELELGGLGLALPLLARRSARDFPVVGCSHDYYAFRGVTFASGDAPLVLGDAVLGSRVARHLGLGVGDHLLTDRGSLYELSSGYPLRLEIVGVLAPTGSADDGAVLVDIQTAWIIEGIGHGHTAAEGASPDEILESQGGAVALNASVVEYTEITPDNIDSFHFHAAPDELPLTAVLVVPRDSKEATLLKGRYRVSDDAQLLVPTEVIDELMGFVFRIKAFFDANVILVSIATILFLVLVVLLDLRARTREIETLRRIGCARGTLIGVLATEMGLILTTALAAAGLLAMLLVWYVGRGILGA